MRSMEPIEKPVTTEEERIVDPCPGCGKSIERVIPAGMSVAVTSILRKVVLTCDVCAAAAEAREEAAKARIERKSREDECGLPPMLRRLTWESYDTTRPGAEAAKAAMHEWALGVAGKRGLMLVGPVGVGKTRGAATATWEALDRYALRYVNVADLIIKTQAAFGDRDRQVALRILTGRGPIVLDDLDKVNPSMHVLAHLYAAIDGRVQAGAPMFVTTNLDPRSLLAKFARVRPGEDAAERLVTAEAIVSRLVGHCRVVRISGADGRA